VNTEAILSEKFRALNLNVMLMRYVLTSV